MRTGVGLTSHSGITVPSGRTRIGILPSGLSARYCSDLNPPSSLGVVISYLALQALLVNDVAVLRG